MIGLDTNCMLRFLLRDDDRQAQALAKQVSAVLDTGHQLLISDVVLAELFWVLRRRYKFDRPSQIQALEHLLEGQQFAFERKEVVQRALSQFKQSNVDFSDCLICEKNRAIGCDYTLTFDAKALGLEGFQRV
jgi:predicted nucleic-acid-binding protein